MLGRKKTKQAFQLNNRNRVITDINELFVEACENGDYPMVARILEEIKDFNIDVTDTLGKSALRLAIENEHLEVVQVLITKSDSQKLREALLLAIYLGHTQIAELILRHPKYKVLNEKKFVNESTDSFWQTPSSDDAQFSPDITPLILAAQYKRTEIVQMLLLGGDRIVKPHDYQCKCNECSNKFKFDSLRHAQSRLNAFRGLSSESYISLASMDPIQTAFELGYEVRNLAMKEKYFKNEYLQLAENLSLYAVKLMNNVRGRDELETILDKTGKENEEKYSRLARIDLAIRFQEKPFVAHSNCQQKLVEVWYSGIRKISKMHKVLATLFLLLFVLLMPFLCFISILAPATKAGKFIRQPCVKFLAHSITYCGFIGLLIVSSLKFSEEQQSRDRFSVSYSGYKNIFANYTRNKALRYRFPVSDFYIRMNSPSNLDYAITLWVLGYVWQEIQLMYHNTLRLYSLSWSNLLKFGMSILYVASFGLKYYTIVNVALQRARISSPEFWEKVQSLKSTDYDSQKDVYETFYWLNDDRFYWMPLDPMNLAEGLFAIGNLASFMMIMFLLPANQALGPLQITLGKMVSDVVKFVVIFGIFFAAFVFALNNIYWYYSGEVRGAVEILKHGKSIPKAEVAFSTITKTLNTAFWGLFGLSTGFEGQLDPFENVLTESIGSFIFGGFYITAIVILINMLIAMMTKSYETIRGASDIEWKFARSKLYMEYMKDSLKLPVPFNLIPTSSAIKSIYYRISNLKNKGQKGVQEQNIGIGVGVDAPTRSKPRSHDDDFDIAKPKAKKANGKLNAKDANVVRRVSTGGNDLTYAKVVQRIIKRFLLRNDKDSEEGNEGDMDELKQDLQMVRFEMHNHLRKAKTSALRSLTCLHTGVSIIGTPIVDSSDNISRIEKFQDFKSYEKDMKEVLEDIAQ